jgi:hypothetical protein
MSVLVDILQEVVEAVENIMFQRVVVELAAVVLVGEMVQVVVMLRQIQVLVEAVRVQAIQSVVQGVLV